MNQVKTLRLAALLLAAVMVVFAFSGCAKQAQEPTQAETQNQTDASETPKDATEKTDETPAESGKVIKIAYVGPMTGDNAEYGVSMSNAVQIAIDDINAAGDTLGAKLELVIFDDKNDATEGTTAAEKACSEADVVGVIGHFSSGVAMAAAEVYEENEMPYIAISAAHPDLCAGEYIFRNNALYDTEASSMLQTVASKGAAKFGMFVPNSDAGVSVTTETQKWLDQFGENYAPELAIIEKYDDGAVDYSAQIQNMIQAGCEVVYTNAPYAVAAPFIKQYKEYDSDAQFITSAASFTPAFLEAAGDAANGVVLATSFFYGSENEDVKAFVSKYTSNYGENPSNFCGQSYDAAYSYYYAMTDCGSTDHAAVRDALHEISFTGLTGAISYNETGECLKQQTLVGIEDGKWVEYPGVLLAGDKYLQSITK